MSLRVAEDVVERFGFRDALAAFAGGVALRGGTPSDSGGQALQKVENATAVIGKTLLIAEKSFKIVRLARTAKGKASRVHPA